MSEKRAVSEVVPTLDSRSDSRTATSITKRYIYQHLVKRFFDIVFAFFLGIPSFIIVSICYVAIKIETRGPAFFVQTRPGYKGKTFKIFKLRTMIVETKRDGEILSDMERVTKVGNIIRKCSFDELPQLMNVLKGEMSFIGPRPLLVQYLPLYNQEQARRHDVLPGISGWAQVNGRNEITWQQKFDNDVWYVDHISPVLDLKIFCMTLKNVLVRQGINAGVGEIMNPFEGNITDEVKSMSI